MQLAIAKPRIAADRRPAGPVQRRQQAAFGRGYGAGIRVFDRGKQLAQFKIVFPHGDTDNALARGGHHDLGFDHHRRLIGQAQTAEPRQRQQTAVELTRFHPAEARLHIAADGAHRQIRPGMQQLRLTADGSRADDRTRRQRCKRIQRIRPFHGLTQDQHVARILPLERAGKHDAGRQVGFQIFEAMHGEVYATVAQRFMNFFGKQSLAADICQPLIQDPVAGRGDNMLLEDVQGVEHRTEAAELRLKGPRLRQRKRRSACTDTQGQRAAMGFYARFMR